MWEASTRVFRASISSCHPSPLKLEVAVPASAVGAAAEDEVADDVEDEVEDEVAAVLLIVLELPEVAPPSSTGAGSALPRASGCDSASTGWRESRQGLARSSSSSFLSASTLGRR